MLTRRLLGTAIIAVPMLSFPVHADTVSFSVDNDGIIGTDREYSSGLFLRWSSDPSIIGYSLELGQQIWTPSDIEFKTPQPNERAYAGFAYLQGRAHQQTDNKAYKGALMLGIIGPSSMAESGQSIVHTIIGSPDPQGWNYQIYDEFIYQLSGEVHQLISRNELGEFSVFSRGQAGNFQSEAAVGSTYRIGVDLGNTFGSTSVLTSNTIDVGMLSNSNQGMFFFTTLEARYRFNDVTIEGDKSAANSDLSIENIQGAASTGFTWYSEKWGATASVTMLSKQYTSSSRHHHSYGNITVFYRY